MKEPPPRPNIAVEPSSDGAIAAWFPTGQRDRVTARFPIWFRPFQVWSRRDQTRKVIVELNDDELGADKALNLNSLACRFAVVPDCNHALPPSSFAMAAPTPPLTRLYALRQVLFTTLERDRRWRLKKKKRGGGAAVSPRNCDFFCVWLLPYLGIQSALTPPPPILKDVAYFCARPSIDSSPKPRAMIEYLWRGAGVSPLPRSPSSPNRSQRIGPTKRRCSCPYNHDPPNTAPRALAGCAAGLSRLVNGVPPFSISL